jgi:hypothetical protein
MSNPSNLYAEKIFAEQPLAVWPLDDKLDFLSLISDNKRDLLATGLDAWSIENGSVLSGTTKGPIANADSYQVEGVSETVEPALAFVTLTSSTLFNLNALSQGLGSFSVSTYIYKDFANIKSVQLGYQIGSLSPIYGNTKTLVSGVGMWGLISETFPITETSGNVKIIIKVGYTGDPQPFEIHGITVGQWSEPFQKESLGIFSELIEEDISLETVFGVPAESYGFGESSGFYLVSNNNLGAKNFGPPMVYGSSSCTTLNPVSGPSLVIPGFGFLNESGQYRDLTLEFWLRVFSGSSEPKRICGPVSSDDGIYVDGPFIRVKINNHVGSYFVGEWERPMLLDFSVINNSASLLLNGEKVISLSIDTQALSLPSLENSSGKNQDWIGFYSHEAISPIQIDAVAIYPYLVTQIVAKRRFVYGQGIDVPQNINSSYSTSSVIVDYSFANYANNYNYPSIGKWENGVLDNLVSDGESLLLPNYSLPTVAFSNKTEDDWISDLSNIQTQENKFFSLRPSSDWLETNGYLLFSSTNILDGQVKGFYGSFVKTSTGTQRETLARLLDKNSKNYLDIVLSGSKLSYIYSENNQEQVIKEFANIAINNEFFVGIDFDRFAQSSGKQVSSFFNNLDQIEIYVAGTKEFENTFSGNVYNFSFFNKDGFSKISTIFGSDGTLNYKLSLVQATNSGSYDPEYSYFGASSDYVEDAFEESSRLDLSQNLSTYSLILNELLGRHYLDIGVFGYWTDYVPLSYLSKYVRNANNDPYYSLDFIQVNVDIPVHSSHNNVSVKSFVQFQSLNQNAYEPESVYTLQEAAPDNLVIEPEGQWAKTRYGFKSGTVVYPPLNNNIQNLALGIRLEFSVKGILQNPVRVKSLELASQAYNDLSPTGILTKNGISIFPYTKNGIYFDYKRRNPVSVYKGSSPHLYLTNASGIKLAGDQKIGLSRGVSMPINQSSAASYGVGAFQFFGKYDNNLFPTAAEELFEIESSDRYIKFYIQATDQTRKRGKIYAFNTVSGRLEQGVVYSLNGKETSSPIIESREWFILGIQFPGSVSFNNIQGAFRLTGAMTVNTVSHYKYTAFQQNQVLVSRPWAQVLSLDGQTKIWEFWADDFTWDEVLYVLSLQKKLIDLKQIHQEYLGTNKKIVSDKSVFKIKNYKYIIYDDISWQNQTRNAV